MSTLGFPSNPTVGDRYTVGSTTYEWNGYAWIIASSVVTATSVTTTGTINITNTTSSTGTNSGALVVGGGAGIGGDLYVGGNINATSTGTTISFSTGTFETLRVTGTNSATSTLTGALVVTGGAAIGGDLWLGGILYSGGQPVITSSTFAQGIQDGVDIDIVEITTGTSTYLVVNNVSTLQSVTGRGNSTTNIVSFLNTTNSTSTDTGAVTVIGGLGVGGRITAESVRIVDAVFDSTETLVNTTATTAIDTFDISEFRSAKYLIQIDEGTGAGADFELIEILLVADNDGNVWATEYGVVTSNGYLGEFEAEVVGGIVSLYFTASYISNKNIKVLRTGMAA
jgi:hypothetical protein